MTAEQFAQFVSSNTSLAQPIKRATSAGPTKQLGVGLEEAIALAMMYPVVRFVIKEIGLPWLVDVGRYAKLWQERFHKWVDEEYEKHGLDPDSAEAKADALRRELEKVTDKATQKEWEGLSDQIDNSEE